MFMNKMENDKNTKLHERRSTDDEETNFFIDENDMGL